MKKISKTILGFVLGIFVAFTLDVAAETLIDSGAVSYSNSKTAETTVDGALDELFSAVDINQKIGTTDISAIGDGTITGAISTQQNQINEQNNTLALKQNVATAITTSNIGSQSVNYATSAGSATSAGTASTVNGLKIKAYEFKFGDSVSETFSFGETFSSVVVVLGMRVGHTDITKSARITSISTTTSTITIVRDSAASFNGSTFKVVVAG